MLRPTCLLAAALAIVTSSCASQTPATNNPVIDSGQTADVGPGAVDASGQDVLTPEDGDGGDGEAIDSTIDASGLDALDETLEDTGMPMTVDAPAPMDVSATIACNTAGGICVAVAPASCPAPGVVLSATMYTCPGGAGAACCMPGDAGTPVDTGTDVPHDTGTATDSSTSVGSPVCHTTGTQGWYTAAGALICAKSCSAAEAPRCQRIGETAQGWYTTSGYGCPPDVTLIVHDPHCT